MIGGLLKYLLFSSFKILLCIFIILCITTIPFFNIFVSFNSSSVFTDKYFPDKYISTHTVESMAEDIFELGQMEIISVSKISDNANNSHNILAFYILISLFSCVLHRKGKFTIAKLIINFLVFFFFCPNGNILNRSKIGELKNCPNKSFFTIETIKTANHISSSNMRINLCLFALNKLQIKEKQNLKFYKYLILLSGDISLNPGPNQNFSISDNKFEPFCKRGLHFLHININSLLSKIDELRDIVSRTKPAVLGITESKLDSSVNDQEVCISGYNLIRNDRNRNGGGVACYIRNDLCFNRRNVFSDSLEHVFFDILIPKTKPISIGIFYRPPNANNFFETFLIDLKKVNFNKNEVYILGDFNVNLLQNNKFVLKENRSVDFRNSCSPLLSKYKEMCQQFSLKELIKDATRITSTTSSLLDHILTNCDKKVSQKGVIDVGISDHQLIFCTRKILRVKANMHNQVRVRSLKKYSPEIYVDELRKINFPNYSIFSDVNVAYSDLVEKLKNVIDKVAPLKEVRIKNNTQDWFDDEVAKAIKLRDKRFTRFKATKLQIDEDLYKEAKYDTLKLIKTKKAQFYKTKLKENIGKPKELWKALKSLGLPSKKGSSFNICLEKNNNIHFDDKTNSNTFKEFYCNLASDLVNKLPPPSNKFGMNSVRIYYQNILDLLPCQFKFSMAEEEKVYKLLKNLDIDKAAGLDNLSARFLKDGSEVLAKPITQICNLSIKYSIFPTDCQIAKLKPLFKKGSTTLPKNYRPISLLPLISKIFEKVIHDQTQAFLDENKILFKFQSGFRQNFSTDSCLSYLNNKITTGFESGLHTGMILIDLQKAFDTINHDILINKMEFLGFSKEVTCWFKSYLSNRKFIVNLKNTFSEPGHLSCGVPQGSILGPLLFLLYINDMPQAVSCELLLYADDTCLIFQHKDVKEIEKQLNSNFSLICDWFVDNKLSIHFGEDKTKSILFSSKNKVKKASPLNIQYNDIKIKQYSKVTYLGCILDETLSGESMANHVLNKVNSRLKFLYRQNKFLDIPLRRLLCNAMIQPFFDYACNAWYPNLNKKLKTRLQAAQNKCIRFCLKLGDRTSVKVNEFEKINWLPIQERVNQRTLSFVYKFQTKKGPDYLEEIFSHAKCSGIPTRYSFQKLSLPIRKTNQGLRALSYIGPSLWNKLNNSLKSSTSLNEFKHNYKENYFHTANKSNQ